MITPITVPTPRLRPQRYTEKPKITAKDDEQQRSGCSLRTCYEGSGYDVSESSDNNQRELHMRKMEKRNLPLFAQSCIDNLADSFAVKTDGGVQSTEVVHTAEEDTAD